MPMRISSEGYAKPIDRELTVTTDAISYLEIPRGYVCEKLSLWNQTLTAAYKTFFCTELETLSVTGADVTYIDGNVVTGGWHEATIAGKTITDVSAAAAAVITCAGHGFANVAGNTVYITGVVSADPAIGDLEAAINGKVHTITYVDANSFSIAVNTSALQAYASGGSFVPGAYNLVGKYLKIGAAAPYVYHEIWKNTNTGVLGVDGNPANDTSAQIVTLPCQVVHPDSTRDSYYKGATGFQFKASGGICTVQAVAHCNRR